MNQIVLISILLLKILLVSGTQNKISDIPFNTFYSIECKKASEAFDIEFQVGLEDKDLYLELGIFPYVNNIEIIFESLSEDKKSEKIENHHVFKPSYPGIIKFSLPCTGENSFQFIVYNDNSLIGLRRVKNEKEHSINNLNHNLKESQSLQVSESATLSIELRVIIIGVIIVIGILIWVFVSISRHFNAVKFEMRLRKERLEKADIHLENVRLMKQIGKNNALESEEIFEVPIEVKNE